MHKSYVLSAVGPSSDVIYSGDPDKEFHAINMKVTAPYGTVCTVAIETSIDGTTWAERDRVTGPGWAAAGLNFTEQYIRPNVHDLGGAASVSVVINGWLTNIVQPPPTGGGGPPAGSIVAASSATPYDWVMTALAYSGPVLYTVPFGHADETAAPVTTMDITGNDTGALSVNNSGLVAVVTKELGATLTVTDSVAGQNWTFQKSGGADGCVLHTFWVWLAGHQAADVITVTSDIPVHMIGGAFELTETGNSLTVPNVNTGNSTAAWVANPHTGGDAVPVIASPNGQPKNPAGYTFPNSVQGATLPLYFTISRGTPAP